MKENFEFGPWQLNFTPDDGARLDRVTYDHYDLVTTPPRSFREPDSDYGEVPKAAGVRLR